MNNLQTNGSSSLDFLKNFLFHIPQPAAFSNTDLKIIFTNDSFQKYFGLTEENISISSLFHIDESDISNLTDTSHLLNVTTLYGDKAFSIRPVFINNIKTGFSILPMTMENTSDEEDFKRKEYLFQKEWENILTLLLKEKSLEILSQEILMRVVNLSKSSFGIIMFIEDYISSQIEYKIYDEDNHLGDKQNAISEIKSNLSYIFQWLKINQKTLIIKKSDINNIAYNLVNILQKDYVIVTPCSFNRNIQAIMIFARSDYPYSMIELNILEQLSALFAFTISNTVTNQLNTALESKLQQSQKLETIGKLASGMAHDFNNLLSSIFGSLNLLKRKLNDRQEVFYLLENIENCSIRAADLTKGLLSYGKPTPKRRTVIKPADLLKELAGVIQQTFPGSINIETNIDPSLADIIGNATEIYQVLLNLCINAKEAITGDGNISVSAENFIIDDKKIFDYPLLKQGSYVKFSVIDSGEGISEANILKIFDPYFSTKQKETGSGLGLYVTYGIVKAHYGHIEVKSKLKKGTQFEVYIPAFEKHRETIQIKTEKIILLADDEVMLRDLLAELLESYNFEVVCVQNGKEVLTLLTEEIKVDLLIIDYKMPEMDGITCIKKIRESGLDIPVILSTGSASFKSDKEFKKLKINSILNKPYEFEEMLSEVQKLI